MNPLDKHDKLIDLAAMRILSQSATEGTICARPTPTGWKLVFLSARAKNSMALRSQRNPEQPRFFSTLDAAAREASRAGFKAVLAILELPD